MGAVSHSNEAGAFGVEGGIREARGRVAEEAGKEAAITALGLIKEAIPLATIAHHRLGDAVRFRVVRGCNSPTRAVGFFLGSSSVFGQDGAPHPLGTGL